MIDIHCHILHGVDDGAKSMEESLEMCRIAVEDGITEMIATPHFTSGMRNYRPIVEEKVKELQAQLVKHRIPIVVRPGNEVNLYSAETFYDEAERDLFCYLDRSKRYLLLEQPWTEYHPNTVDVVKWLRDKGTTPILAHPERLAFFRQEPALLLELIQAGCWTQVSADSLVGRKDKDAQQFSQWMLEHDLVHTLATDAHNTVRKPNLSEGLNIVESLHGTKRAQEITGRLQLIQASV